MARVFKKQVFKGFSTVSGNTNVLFDIDLIKQDLMNHFNTRKRERVMDPEYGSIIWDLLFENFNEEIDQLIIDDCRRIVESDPRLQLEEVFLERLEYGYLVHINVYYRPFDLTETLDVLFEQDVLNQE